jgi:predicted secreted protein
MNPVTIILVFSCIWWIIFFMALPVGIRNEDHFIEGQEKGAPKNPNLLIKAIVTTIVSIVLTSLYFYLMQAGFFSNILK